MLTGGLFWLQVSSNEYFSVSFEVSDDAATSYDREEFLPATRGTYLVWVKHYCTFNTSHVCVAAGDDRFSRIANGNATIFIDAQSNRNMRALGPIIHVDNRCITSCGLRNPPPVAVRTRKMRAVRTCDIIVPLSHDPRADQNTPSWHRHLLSPVVVARLKFAPQCEKSCSTPAINKWFVIITSLRYFSMKFSRECNSNLAVYDDEYGWRKVALGIRQLHSELKIYFHHMRYMILVSA